jgi:hypothetical protein
MLFAWRQSSEHHATCFGSRGRRIRCERMGDWSHCRHGRRGCRCSKRGSSCGDLLGCEGGAASCERRNARRNIQRTHTPKSSACRATSRGRLGTTSRRLSPCERGWRANGNSPGNRIAGAGGRWGREWFGPSGNRGSTVADAELAEQRLLITAVNAETGERFAFDRTAGSI